jgi:ankyrin repeat protein
MAACIQNATDVVKVFLGREAVDINRQDYLGLTALSLALINKGLEAALLRHDVDLTLPDTRGRTPLHWACNFDHRPLVSQLLQRDNVDPNARDNRGHTPLAYACGMDNVHLVALLLRHRDTDPNTVNNRGISEEIAAFLRAAGAK